MDSSLLLRMQAAAGMGAEDAQMIVESMAQTGVEPTYCMGDDIPLAVLSDKAHPLYNYFKQRFAQVRILCSMWGGGGFSPLITVLSDKAHPLCNYFKQTFAQVPIFAASVGLVPRLLTRVGHRSLNYLPRTMARLGFHPPPHTRPTHTLRLITLDLPFPPCR